MTCVCCDDSRVVWLRAIGRWVCGACIDRMLVPAGWVTPDGWLHDNDACRNLHSGGRLPSPAEPRPGDCEALYRLVPKARR